ncbi:MAG: Phosphoesterase, PA-phosphatase related protein [Phycisphaerales bacterium]|nr:Phosphoesterase, PA-phosphatase related protein [Phycisphaerales bacterium]
MRRRIDRGRRIAGAAFVTTERLESRMLFSVTFDAFAQLERVDTVSVPGSTTATVRITYEGPTIDTSTFDSNDIMVTTLQGFHAAGRFAGIDPTDPGAGHGMRVADYFVQAPFSTFGLTPGQNYNVILQANQVSDTSLGFLPTGNIGSFEIPTPVAGAFTVSVDGQTLADGQTVDFGDALAPLGSVIKAVTLTNTSTGAITPQVNAVQFQNGAVTPSPFSILSGDVIPASLAAGASTTFHVIFSPAGFSTPGQVQSFSAAIAIGGTGLASVIPLQPFTLNASATLAGLTSVTVPVKGLPFIDAAGKKVTVKVTGPGTAVLGFISSTSPFHADPSLLTLTGTTAKTKVTITSTGGMTLGGLTADGPIGSFTATRTTLGGDFTVNGGIGALSVSAASSGIVSAFSIGSLTSSGGFLAALVVGPAGAAPPGAVLGTVNVRGPLAGTWAINGGVHSLTAASINPAFSGSIAGLLAKMVVKGNAGGDLAALAMGSIQIGGNLANARYIAGANFGADARIGGSNDTYGPGSIGSFSVGGATTGSLVAAGFDPVDGIFFNGNDVIDGGAASVIKSISVRKTSDANSRFFAGAFSKVKIAGKTVNPAADIRFMVS